MKNRIFTLILVVLMIVTAMPVSADNTGKAEEIKTVFSAYEIYYDAQVASVTTVTLEMEEHDGIPYAAMNAKAGTYGNSSLVLTLKSSALNFNIFDYPIAAIGYKTNAKTPGVDASMIYDGYTETWSPNGTRIPITSDEKLHQITVDVLDMNAKVELKPTYKAIDVRLKPWGGHDQNLTTDQYFDIAYIAFFPSVKEAEAFEYVPMTEEEYFAKNAVERVEKTVNEYNEDILLDYIAKEEALKYEIINSPNTEFVQASKTYYVSPNGDDNNDGLAPETAWKTLDKVNDAVYGKDNVVRFERGGIWRGNLKLKAGVIYSAYGEGAKPSLYGSVNATGAENWVETENPNIYKLVKGCDFGKQPWNIVFNGGEAWGVCVMLQDGKRIDQGTVFNGIESFECPAKSFTSYADLLSNNLEFWYDGSTEDTYIYCEYGNPGEYFDDIEVSFASAIINGRSNEIIIDNINMMYGRYGITVSNTDNFTVQNCTFGWLGGFGAGNAVECWDNAKRFTIDHCYAYQIYDCCWTAQSRIAGMSLTIQDVTFTNNVCEYSNNGLEIWFEKNPDTSQTGLIKNVKAENNYTLYSGYGWSHLRPSKDGNFFYGGTSQNDVLTFENCNFNNNVNIHAYRYGLYSRFLGKNSFNFDNNIYMMIKDRSAAMSASNLPTGMGMLMTYGYNDAGVSLLATMGNDVNSTYYYLPDSFTPLAESKLHDFTDVYGHWGLENISYAVLKGLFAGTTDTTFTPNGKMTRAMLVTVLSRLAGDANESAKSTYTDVAFDAWYASAAAWAEAKGIVDKGGKFRPDDNATREEMADMLYRYAKAYGKDVSKKAELTFIDASTITYTDGVAYCTGAGIIAGYDDNTVKPTGEATRAEVATMLRRFILA